MATATWAPDTLATVTLTEGTWDTIRTAVLCLACDCRTAGKHDDADHWFAAYKALKEATGAIPSSFLA